MTTVRRAAVGLLLAAFLALGCGSEERGAVEGKVLLGNREMTGGTVTFVGADGKESSGPIRADGTYKVSGVAVGEARIAVRTRRIPTGLRTPSGPGARAEAPAGTAPPVPERYNRVETSELTYQVRSGAQTYTIALRP